MAERLHGTFADPTREELLREVAKLASAPGELPPQARALLARAAFDETSALVAVLAPDGTVLEVNAPACASAGVARDALVARPLRDGPWWRGSPEAAARVEAAVRRAAAGEAVRWEVDVRSGAAADALTMDLSLRPVADAAGAVVLLVAEARDVTALRRERGEVERELAGHAEDAERLAGELARRRRELETALDAMRFAREQADRASAQKTGLLRIVSHELRTPLAALVLQVDRLRRDAAELSPHHRDAVGRMRSALGRLSTLVDSLLEFSRIDAGRVTIAPVRLDPAAVAAGVVEELRPLAAAKALALSAPPAGSAPPLETDPRLLRLVVYNLVQNAIKFTDAGTVSVTIEAEDGEHRVAVRDTGRGIAPEDQARIFEPFEQLEAIARKHTPGIGLGLTLVRELVAALGGRIALESTPGAGSTFTVSLPSRRRLAGRDLAPALTPPPQ